MRITNRMNLPDQIVRALNDEYAYKVGRYSVTNLLSSPREMIMKRRYNHHEDYTMDVADSVALLLGNSIHLLMENIKLKDGELVEKKYTAPFIVNGFVYTFSGIVDFIQTLEDEIVGDYKTCGVYAILFGSNDEKWKDQLRYGAYLHWVNTGQWINKGRIIYFIKDWKQKELLTNPNYPKSAIGYIDYDLGDVRDVHNELQDKFVAIHKYEQMSDIELPLCTVEERWGVPEKWATMQGKQKRAKKLHEDEMDAHEHAGNIENGWVQKRKGSDRKCVDYCQCNIFCDYWKKNYGS